MNMHRKCTGHAFVSSIAAAGVIVDGVDAGAELAGTGRRQGALVDVDLTVVAFESGQTAAHVAARCLVGEVGEHGRSRVARHIGHRLRQLRSVRRHLGRVVQRPVGAFQARGSVLARNSL